MCLEPYFVPFDIFVADYKDPQSVLVPIILPHEIFAAVYNAGPEQWRRSMIGENDTEGVMEWWENAMQTPWGATHPALADAEHLDTCVPFVLHEDGAESFTEKEAHIFRSCQCFAQA